MPAGSGQFVTVTSLTWDHASVNNETMNVVWLPGCTNSEYRIRLKTIVINLAECRFYLKVFTVHFVELEPQASIFWSSGEGENILSYKFYMLICQTWKKKIFGGKLASEHEANATDASTQRIIYIYMKHEIRKTNCIS